MADEEKVPLAADVEQTTDDDSSRRHSGKPPLERVDEVDQEGATGCRKSSTGKSCPDFGVRSYLHHFYDSKGSFKDPSIYEEEDDEDDLSYLLRPRKRKRCTSIWWKIFVWIGANLLIFGIIGVLVSFLIPPHREVVGVENNIEKVDRGAVYFNYNLDICKLISLIVFCVGGVTLTIALIFPSFFTQYFDDSRGRGAGSDDEFKVRLTADQEPSDVNKRIPVTAKVRNVQPKERPSDSTSTVTFME